jgi:hypothetical protein
MNVKYKQCSLSRKDGDKIVRQVSWIPVKWASTGQVLKLKANNEWTDGWVVDSVGLDILDQNEVPDSHKAVKEHRKRTGDNLPKRRQS